VQIQVDAARWFRGQLERSAPVRAYLTARGITAGTADVWGLGYAPKGDGLLHHLEGRGWSRTMLLAGGLALDAPLRARFTDRLMFPLRDERGLPLAFAGRALNEGVRAKYLNSPTSLLYRKGRELYGWPNLPAVRATGEALIVEGHLDMLAAWQAGHRHVLALGGTALTAEQLGRLDVPRVTLVLDGDAAGARAVLRALTAPATASLQIGVVTLDPDTDPASLLQRDPGAFERALLARRGRWRYLWDVTRERYADRAATDVEARIAWMEAWVALCRTAPSGRWPRLLAPLARELGGMPLPLLLDDCARPPR
jgi:DNA primase